MDVPFVNFPEIIQLYAELKLKVKKKPEIVRLISFWSETHVFSVH